MASRISARTAASRNQAASPPRQSTRSPVARRTRTRSASVELESNAPTTKRGKRSTRQTSVESVESNTSAASTKQRGGRKKAKEGDVAYPGKHWLESTFEKLSTVAEGGEEEEEEEREENEEEAGNIEVSGHLQQSPGHLSQISGTTAITSASVQSSYSATEVNNLDLTMVVEVLPGLWFSSLQLLSLLAPENATTESVESIVRQLKVPGSSLAKVLKHREDKFDLDKETLGKDDYIRSSFILQKLYNSSFEPGMPRPDAVLHAANLATLVKNLLVAPKEATSTFNFFSNLDTWFPESFITQFEDNLDFGNSTMRDESFALALEIRTQYAVACLLHHKSSEHEWHPDEILVEPFFENILEYTPGLPRFEDYMKNGKIKNLMRAGPENTETQNEQIRKRAEEIHNTFRQSEVAARADDLVDFDRLEKRFPWSTFLFDAVQWIRNRLDEVEASIFQQGGVEKLVKSLVDVIKSNQSQDDLDFEPHPSTTMPRELLPSANIVPSNAGHSVFTPNTARVLEELKQRALAPASNQGGNQAMTSRGAATSSSNQTHKSSRAGPSRSRATGPLEPSQQPQHVSNDSRNPPMDDDEETVAESVDRRAVNVLNGYERGVTNKENHRARWIDEQPNARKASWGSQEGEESQDMVAGPSKRKQPDVESDVDFLSQDQGFQTDQRNPDPSRRFVAAPPSMATHSSAPPQRRSTKRARYQEEEIAAQEADQTDESEEGAAEDPKDRRKQQRSQPQPRAPQQADDDVFDLSDDGPRPSATQVATMAKTAFAVARRVGETQSRTPWSEADTEHLIELIGELGCSWALISKAGDFEVERGQIALKDKARNLTVQFLRAGMRLPLNFDKVALGQKEIKSVQSVRPDYRYVG
ncbi:hypothetical protein D0Z07_3293 [Hyphodiscus hymeniophilus]|uniref:Myb-like domain-containing protein n=1 Tax=Hyphodiscus hymeniophilus TaxID=353542 RepID=A0A9P6VMD0_9HELO|nr:hypothetical protein D0Z07_3293 [Hyphodiscus hymeniophilus]